MKKKSNKLVRLERNRKSVFTNNLEYCYICGKQKNHMHEIFEGSNRLNSMKYGYCLPLCFQCHNKIHNDRELSLYYKRLSQQIFEKNHTREEFINIFRRSYL